MAKNGDTKRKGKFFTKPQKNPKPDLRNPQHQKNKSKFRNFAQDQNLTPSVSGSNDFFVKPTSATGIDKLKPDIAKDIREKKSTNPEKKPFDKKLYRLKKYSKKYRIEQWEQKRKKAILHGYYRTVKDDEPKLDVNAIYNQYKDEIDTENEEDDKANEENENNLNSSISEPAVRNEVDSNPQNSKAKKGKAFKKAHQEFERIRDEKRKKREEILKRKAEKEEALQAYKKKKAEKFKKLSRKTKKGQPIMKERIEMLLERIQNSMKQ